MLLQIENRRIRIQSNFSFPFCSESARSLGKNWRSDRSSIIGFAMAAFLTNNVEVNFSSVIAVITENPNLKISPVLDVTQNA